MPARNDVTDVNGATEATTRRRVLPPVYFWSSVAGSVALHLLVPAVQVAPSPYRWLGLPALLAGTWIVLWTDRLFTRRQTTVKPYEAPSTLLVEGPFRVSRNPMYVGMVVALLGLATVLGSATAYLPAAAFWLVMDRVFVPAEEQILARTLGPEFLRYRRAVRRWV